MVRINLLFHRERSTVAVSQAGQTTQSIRSVQKKSNIFVFKLKEISLKAIKFFKRMYVEYVVEQHRKDHDDNTNNKLFV